MSALPFTVLLLTDERAAAAAGRSVVETVALALDGSASSEVAVLLRAKGSDAGAVDATARALLPHVQRAGARLIIHSHVDVALRVGAFGVHLSDKAAAPTDNTGLFVGGSRHADAPLDEEDLDGLHYAALAPVFPPTSKLSDVRPTLGLEGLRERCERSHRPIVALGGMDPTRARACLDAGADAVAVLGSVMAAADPGGHLRALVEACG